MNWGQPLNTIIGLIALVSCVPLLILLLKYRTTTTFDINPRFILFLVMILVSLGIGFGERQRYKKELLDVSPPYYWYGSWMYSEGVQRGTKEVKEGHKNIVMSALRKLSEEDEHRINVYFWEVSSLSFALGLLTIYLLRNENE